MSEYDKYFEKEENLEQIFIDCKDVIEGLNEYRKQFLANVLTSDADLKTALAFYTGAIQTFHTLFELSQAYKESQEDYISLKLRNGEFETSIKITDASVKTTAHYEIRNYIKVRNLLKAYVDSCEKGISTCQTLLKYVYKESDRVQE